MRVQGTTTYGQPDQTSLKTGDKQLYPALSRTTVAWSRKPAAVLFNILCHEQSISLLALGEDVCVMAQTGALG